MTSITQKVLSQGYQNASTLSTYKGLAIMMIDMQKSFISGKLLLQDEMMLYAAHADIMQRLCIDNYVPLVNVMYVGSGIISPVIKSGLQKVPMLFQYMKSTPKAFEKNSRLASNLKKMDIDTILMMGIYASACVYDSAIGALEHDFNVVTAEDIIADCIRLRLRNTDKRKEEFVKKGIKYYDSYSDYVATLNPDCS